MKPVIAFLGAAALLFANSAFSTPARAAEANRPPNIVVILADDMGFSDLGCYGGEIATPHLDQLAANGLRFSQFYNTARCWPTRACLMSGYYAQQIRMDPPEGRLPPWTRLLPHHLKARGYRCYHSGKWHVTGAPQPVADGGFDRSYRFEDWDRYFTPSRHFIGDQQAPPVAPGSGYYATTAFTDHALRFLEDHARQSPGQPFLLYLAFIAPHFPLQALPEDIARYSDRYQEGWDVIRERRWQRLRDQGIVNHRLPPLDPQLQPRYLKNEFLEKLGPGETPRAVPWSSLSATQREFQARKMAIHAAMVDRLDREVGRVLDQLRAMQALENTVVFFLSDNGADATLLIRGDGHDPNAAPGSARSFLCLGPGWASASNSPFRRHKIWVHEGGIATPLIVHWPAGLRARGQLRHDVGHVIDLVPTILELTGTPPSPVGAGSGAPPFPGRSLLPAFDRDGAIVRDSLFFHHEGNRALREGDWKLVSAREDGDGWELYDLATDRGETVNLAHQHPDRVRRMREQWMNLEARFRRDAATNSHQTGPEDKSTVDGGAGQFH